MNEEDKPASSPMTSTQSPLKTTSIGAHGLRELVESVRGAQADDPFARVVVIADSPDVATALRHELGAFGVLNVTVQTGRHLAAELAVPVLRRSGTENGEPLRPLTRMLERQAVRSVTEKTIRQRGFQSLGGLRLRSSLATAFRRMQERPASADEATSPPGDMGRLAEALLNEYLELVHGMGCFTPAELPGKAAEAVASRGSERRKLPHVIYYLPRRLSTGDLALAQALLKTGRCEVILGLSGDDEADRLVRDLMGQLSISHGEEQPDTTPLQQVVESGNLRIIAAPDPEEEVRTVIRSIVADDLPLHRTAVIYRQDSPYASLVRQEMVSAGIPYSGIQPRTLAGTPSGLLLLGLVDTAVDLAEGSGVQREALVDWITSTPVRFHIEEGNDTRRIPASSWADMSRVARANGPPDEWSSRLQAHIEHEEARAVELYGEITRGLRNERRQAEDLAKFVSWLARSLVALGQTDECDWETASSLLARLMRRYRWAVTSESEDDRRRIDEIVESLSEFKEWGEPYSAQTLRQVVREELRTAVSERGRPVGSGVYLGPPSGVAGASYGSMYFVGMVEKQFPPRVTIDPWLETGPSLVQRELSMERYDFLAALASTDRAVLCWPAATAERAASYPSRWLIEAANLLHRGTGSEERLSYDSITENTSEKPWLAYIPSREAGLRGLANSTMAPADLSDYNLSGMVSMSAIRLHEHPAISSDHRMVNALESRTARAGSSLTAWDGLTGQVGRRIRDVGSIERPVSPSALETWATCPYRYFLGRVLGLSAPEADDDGGDMSPMERGLLVHRILERFAKGGSNTEEELLCLAEDEFKGSERRGQTGYPLLWEIRKEEIRAGLRTFLANDSQWLGDVPFSSDAEVSFGPETDCGDVVIAVDNLGDISFRGKIDRVDILEDELRVRDFKTGRPDPYRDGTGGEEPARSVGNGLALQLPIYLEAAQLMYPDRQVTASYCFPLADRNTHGVGPYTEENREQFHETLRLVLGTIRNGVFPATPEGSPGTRGINCSYCEFDRLCPTGRRQMWERKGRADSVTRPFNDLQNRASVQEGPDAG